jgi:hypothetical protein
MVFKGHPKAPGLAELRPPGLGGSILAKTAPKAHRGCERRRGKAATRHPKWQSKRQKKPALGKLWPHWVPFEVLEKL